MFAFQALKSSCYDLVLCDYRMPHQNGDALVATFREWEKANRPPARRQCIYGLTAYGTGDVQKVCVKAGMDGVLGKPIELDQIRRVIDGILRCRPSNEALSPRTTKLP